jgi:hypothetical protein
MKKIPDEVKHDWKLRERARRAKGPQVYVCATCKSRTANLPLYKDDVCEAKDRRKGAPDRRAR